MKNIVLITWCYLIAIIPSFAQIVNIEAKRTAAKDTVLWMGYVDVKFNLINNGAQLFSINGDYRLEHIRNKHLFLYLGQYNLGKAEGAEFVDDGFQHIRYNYRSNDWLTLEGFTQLQYNQLIKLKLRWLLGAGPRFQLYKKQKSQFYLGTLYMFEYNEENTDEEGVVNFIRDHRLSTYISFRLQPTPQVSFTGTTYIQPVLDDFSDVRISTQSSLLFKISSKLQFTTNFRLVYDSDVPEGVLHTIYQLTNGLRWNF